MKKLITLAVAGALVATVAGCGNKAATPSPAPAATTGAAATPKAADTAKKPTIGVAIYKFDDTFMTGVRAAIADAAKDKATVDIVDSQNSQPTQNDKVDLFITKKVNALAINAVDRTAAGVIIDKAKAAMFQLYS